MPELPEVETVCRGLAKTLTGVHITRAETRRRDLRIAFPQNLAGRLKGRRIKSIARRAKYILMHLDQEETLLLHLGMSGRMVFEHTSAPPQKHDHLVLHFGDNMELRFNDPRRFGMCDLIKTSQLPKHRLLRHLGLEPFEPTFTPAWLIAKWRGKKTTVKAALLDQRLVVGIGNIYACEALFHAGINPKRLAGKCNHLEIAKLVPAIRKVLKAAIAAGGSSLRDYRHADGQLGYFQHHFAVYDREGKRCPDCSCDIKRTHGIQRIPQGGRSTFYCPSKQRPVVRAPKLR